MNTIPWDQLQHRRQPRQPSPHHPTFRCLTAQDPPRPLLKRMAVLHLRNAPVPSRLYCPTVSAVSLLIFRLSNRMQACRHLRRLACSTHHLRMRPVMDFLGRLVRKRPRSTGSRPKANPAPLSIAFDLPPNLPSRELPTPTHQHATHDVLPLCKQSAHETTPNLYST